MYWVNHICISRMRCCQKRTKPATFFPTSCDLVLHVMPNACDIPIQRKLGFVQCCRISNRRKKLDPICPCTPKHNPIYSGHAVLNRCRQDVDKHRAGMYFHHTHRLVYDSSTEKHGCLIRQDYLERFCSRFSTPGKIICLFQLRKTF